MKTFKCVILENALPLFSPAEYVYIFFLIFLIHLKKEGIISESKYFKYQINPKVLCTESGIRNLYVKLYYP